MFSTLSNRGTCWFSIEIVKQDMVSMLQRSSNFHWQVHYNSSYFIFEQIKCGGLKSLPLFKMSNRIFLVSFKTVKIGGRRIFKYDFLNSWRHSVMDLSPISVCLLCFVTRVDLFFYFQKLFLKVWSFRYCYVAIQRNSSYDIW